MKLKAWGIYKESVAEPVDTVFFHPDCDAEYVRHTLIYCDGYPDTIEVKEINR